MWMGKKYRQPPSKSMRNSLFQLAIVLAAALANAAMSGPPPGVVPLLNAHAHNDYEHSRPLLDALDQGFTSVEADVFPVAGNLLVAHDFYALRPDRTLE